MRPVIAHTLQIKEVYTSLVQLTSIWLVVRLQVWKSNMFYLNTAGQAWASNAVSWQARGDHRLLKRLQITKESCHNVYLLNIHDKGNHPATVPQHLSRAKGSYQLVWSSVNSWLWAEAYPTRGTTSWHELLAIWAEACWHPTRGATSWHEELLAIWAEAWHPTRGATSWHEELLAIWAEAWHPTRGATSWHEELLAAWSSVNSLWGSHPASLHCSITQPSQVPYIGWTVSLGANSHSPWK